MEEVIGTQRVKTPAKKQKKLSLILARQSISENQWAYHN